MYFKYRISSSISSPPSERIPRRSQRREILVTVLYLALKLPRSRRTNKASRRPLAWEGRGNGGTLGRAFLLADRLAGRISGWPVQDRISLETAHVDREGDERCMGK